MTEAPHLTLDDGLELECINALEAVFLTGEVDQYFAHGIELDPGATVLDVGANIGVFTARVLQGLGGDARIYAFEPLPPIHAVLSRNVERLFPGRVHVIPCGLGAREETVPFTFFPLLTVLSSTRRTGDLAAEKKRLADTVLTMIREGTLFPNFRFLPTEFVEAMVESHIASSLRQETHQAQIRPLSAILAEQKIETIDLLKIDVEGAELDVLAGITDPDWPKIRQLVLEVENFDEREPIARGILEARGYTVHSAQDSAQKAGNFGLMYGGRI
jgi:FkbM family methyltransferase